MKKIIFFVFMMTKLWGLDKLDSKYLITFGYPEAKVKVTQYFSFNCPHCPGIYQKDFSAIKESYINNGKIFWTFHPVPLDLSTVQAMECLSHLSEAQKRLFLSAMLEEIDVQDSELTPLLMQKAMECFSKPLPKLRERSFLSESQTFQDAFLFLKQDEKIKALPCIEADGKLYPDDVPSKQFIDRVIGGK